MSDQFLYNFKKSSTRKNINSIFYFYVKKNLLYNILKELSAPVTVYLNTSTVDWSNVMTEFLLPHRVAKTAGGGWGCLFIGCIWH
jgi:hypothetical protein